MRFIVNGRVWKLGDNINTDLIIPGPYLMLRDLDQMALHVLEGVIPSFSKEVKSGDIIIAGNNFGCGSSREIAPIILKHLKVGAVVAESFARIFFRNAINIGLPVIQCRDITKNVLEGQRLKVDLSLGKIENLSNKEVYQGIKLPEFLLQMVEAGGAVEALKRKMGK